MMNKYTKLLITFLILIPLSGCFQAPRDRSAATGEDPCVMISDVLNVGTQNKIVVDYSRPDVGVVQWTVERIEDTMSVAARVVFQTLSENEAFLDIVNTLIALTIAIFAISLLLGVSQASPYATVMFAIKIVFVWAFISSWQLFDEYVITTVEAFVTDLSQTFANVFSEGVRIPNREEFGTIPREENMFDYADRTLSMFFNGNFFRVLMGTATSGWTGLAYAGLLAWMFGSYATAIFSSVRVYIVALIARALLFSLAPFFLIFMLFKQTKSMFDGWMNLIISFSLQPVFLMAFLGMFQLLFVGFMAGIIPAAHSNQQVCYGTWLEISGWLPYLYADQLGNNTPGAGSVSGTQGDMPFNLWVVISLILITSVMKNMAQWSVQVASRLANGFISAFDVPMAGWQDLKSGVTGGAAKATGSAANVIRNRYAGNPR